MRKLLFAALVGVTMVGCSTTKNKDVKVSSSDEVVDAGMHASEPISVNVSGVYDAGVYRENEDYADLAIHGGRNGKLVPTERFYSVDREKHVVLGKVLYVLTDDSPAHCIKGKYAMVAGKKQLIVYSQSTVPSNYCIYQKSFSSDAEGFSIFVKDGGICRPSFTQVSTDEQKRRIASVEPVNNTVSMSYCVDNTFSFGEELVHHH